MEKETTYTEKYLKRTAAYRSLVEEVEKDTKETLMKLLSENDNIIYFTHDITINMYNFYTDEMESVIIGGVRLDGEKIIILDSACEKEVGNIKHIDYVDELIAVAEEAIFTVNNERLE